MSAVITITSLIPAGYAQGDYAQLHSNGGSGEIDWNTPVDTTRYDLFPDGAGLHGFGHGPFGSFPFGHAWADRVRGFGHLPFGDFPFGSGCVQIEATHRVTQCGAYKYGLACYDESGNAHSGSPAEASVDVHIAPAAPAGLRQSTYSRSAATLTLTLLSN